MAQEYWKWPASSWVSGDVDWRAAKSITAGVDVGTTSTQAAIMCDGRLFGYASLHTGVNFAKAAETALQQAMGSSGMALSDIGTVVATGWGSKHVAAASKTMDEIHCHAKGARFMFGPKAMTVVDLGGQTTKAIALYNWDRVRDFMINDKCATGMGRNIEVMADLMQVPIEEMGQRSLEVEADVEPVSTTCYAFANTETIGLFRDGFKEDHHNENAVLSAYLYAIAWRILGLVGRLQPLDVGDVGVEEGLAFTGGLAKNPGVTKRLERELKVTALSSEYDPQLAGAIGAALLADSAS